MRVTSKATNGLGLYYRGGEIYTEKNPAGGSDLLLYGDKGLRVPEPVADLVKQFARIMAGLRLQREEEPRMVARVQHSIGGMF